MSAAQWRRAMNGGLRAQAGKPAAPVAVRAGAGPLQPAAPVADALAARVTELERTVADLRDRLARLEADLGG